MNSFALYCASIDHYSDFAIAITIQPLVVTTQDSSLSLVSFDRLRRFCCVVPILYCMKQQYLLSVY